VEELVAWLLWLFLELAGEVLLEGLFELGIESFQRARGRSNRHPVTAAIGYLLVGAAIGGLWGWLAPARVVSVPLVPGASLLLGPLAAGAAMEAWGRYRRASGRATSNLATWYGGAAFALGIAIVRFFWVR